MQKRRRKTRRTYFQKVDPQHLESTYQKVKDIQSKLLTITQLVSAGAFTSPGQSSTRRQMKYSPEWTTNPTGTRTFYAKDKVLEWVNQGMPRHVKEGKVVPPRVFKKEEEKTSISLPLRKPKCGSISHHMYVELPHWVFELMLQDKTTASRSQWVRDRIIESLVTNESAGLDEALNRAYLILHEGIHGKEGKTKQVTSNC